MAQKSVALANAFLSWVRAGGGGLWTSFDVMFHSDDPGLTGANQIVGVSFVPIVFAAPSDGTMANNALISVSIPAGATVTHWSVWGVLLGVRTFLKGDEMPEETFSQAALLRAATGTLVWDEASESVAA